MNVIVGLVLAVAFVFWGDSLCFYKFSCKALCYKKKREKIFEKYLISINLAAD
jgi:hypothetical protein